MIFAHVFCLCLLTFYVRIIWTNNYSTPRIATRKHRNEIVGVQWWLALEVAPTREIRTSELSTHTPLAHVPLSLVLGRESNRLCSYRIVLSHSCCDGLYLQQQKNSALRYREAKIQVISKLNTTDVHNQMLQEKGHLVYEPHSPQCRGQAVGEGVASSACSSAAQRASKKVPGPPVTPHSSQSNCPPSSILQSIVSLQVGQMLSYSENKMIFHQS